MLWPGFNTTETNDGNVPAKKTMTSAAIGRFGGRW